MLGMGGSMQHYRLMFVLKEISISQCVSCFPQLGSSVDVGKRFQMRFHSSDDFC